MFKLSPALDEIQVTDIYSLLKGNPSTRAVSALILLCLTTEN